MNHFIYVFLLLLTTGCKRNTPASNSAQTSKSPEWISLFNGEDLHGWTPKIKGQPSGQDTLNTFIVHDQHISVSYRNYDNFDDRFGHLFYEQSFSAYYLTLEYRFTGAQVNGGEAWAFKNSGVMYHAQSPSSMLVDQNFPVSLEGQFLGGNGNDPRPTMNLCTPGTHVMIDDSLVTDHCISSTAPTFPGEEWVRADFLVLNDSLVVHYVNGEEVLRFTNPQLGGAMAEDADESFRKERQPLTGGYIALQSESHPIDFKNIYVVDLEPFLGDKEELEELIGTLKKGPGK